MGIKISALPSIVTPALTDVFPVVQSGVTYKETFTQLSSLFANAPVNTNVTSMTGLTGVLQAPTFINDSNGNHILGFSAIASSVNYIALNNQVTGSGPNITAQGIDTNININILPKGTGTLQFISSNPTNPIVITNGTNALHITNFIMANTNVTRNVTFPDQTGTIYLTTKANGVEAANAVTASGTAGVITTSSLTTAGGASYAITWTNTFITTTSSIQLTIMGGSNTTQNVTLTATAGSGSSTLTIYNNTAATALNGTILIGYVVIP